MSCCENVTSVWPILFCYTEIAKATEAALSSPRNNHVFLPVLSACLAVYLQTQEREEWQIGKTLSVISSEEIKYYLTKGYLLCIAVQTTNSHLLYHIVPPRPPANSVFLSLPSISNNCIVSTVLDTFASPIITFWGHISLHHYIITIFFLHTPEISLRICQLSMIWSRKHVLFHFVPGKTIFTRNFYPRSSSLSNLPNSNAWNTLTAWIKGSWQTKSEGWVTKNFTHFHSCCIPFYETL